MFPGPPGIRGPAGPRGARGRAAKSGGGTVYTRWGRKHCPQTTGTNELYSGIKQRTNMHVGYRKFEKEP